MASDGDEWVQRALMVQAEATAGLAHSSHTHLQPAHLDPRLAHVQLPPAIGVAAYALADRSHQATHVGVVTSDGALEERGIDDGLADGACERLGGRAADLHLDHMLHALAVPHNILGKRGTNVS